MSYFEYQVVPAPKGAPRKKGVKGTEARFAANLSDVMNQHAAEGWEFHRAETLPCEARKGLFSTTSVETQSVLVFRRWVETETPEAPLALGDLVRPQEALAAELTPAAKPPAAEMPPPPAPQPAAPAAPRLSAQRGPAGDLQPVPGADRPRS